MKISSDNFFEKEKKFDQSSLINDIPVLKEDDFQTFDMRLFFFMVYDDIYSEKPNYHYLDKFRLFEHFFETDSKDFIYGFVGEIEVFYEMMGGGVEFPNRKRRLFGLGFDFKENKTKLFLDILMMFISHGDYYQRNVHIGLNSLVLFVGDDAFSSNDIRKCVLNLINIDIERDYWNLSDMLKKILKINSDREILILHRTLRHYIKRIKKDRYAYQNGTALSTYVDQNKMKFLLYSLNYKLIGFGLVETVPDEQPTSFSFS